MLSTPFVRALFVRGFARVRSVSLVRGFVRASGSGFIRVRGLMPARGFALARVSGATPTTWRSPSSAGATVSASAFSE